MKLTILIPVYNEEKTINEVIKKISGLKLKFEKEIIVVNDGSTDNTAREISKSRVKNLKVITKKHNAGKGAAIRAGIELATGDYILIQDADLEYNPQEISKLVSQLVTSPKPDITKIAVYGTRFKYKNVEIPKIYFYGNKLLTFITNILFKTAISDMETGYKIIPVPFLKNNKLKSDRFDFEPEITAKLIKNGIKIVEIPITYSGRSHFAGKKLTVKDAFGALRALLYYRFFD